MPRQMAPAPDRFYAFVPGLAKRRIPSEATTVEQRIKWAAAIGATVITKQTGPASRPTSEIIEVRL